MEEQTVETPFIEDNKATEEKEIYEDVVPCFCSQRWILAYTAFFGFLLVYALRVNISVGIVCMVRSNETLPFSNNTQNISISDKCILETDRIENSRAEFDWDKDIRSGILASFFYGYLITQIPAGWFADKFGGKRVFGVSMAISGLATVLLPVCARTSVELVYAMRIIVGLGTV